MFSIRQVCVFLLLLFFFSIVFSENTPNVIEEQEKCFVELHKVAYDSSTNQLLADFVVLNTTSAFIGNLSYVFTMYSQKESFDPAPMIDISKVNFVKEFKGSIDSLAPKNALRYNLSFDVPKNIDSGNYVFNLYIIYNDISPCGMTHYGKVVPLNGNGGIIPELRGHLSTAIGDMNFFDGVGLPSDKGLKIVLPLETNPVVASSISAGKTFFGNVVLKKLNSDSNFSKEFEVKQMVLDNSSLVYEIVLQSGETLSSGPYTIEFSLLDEAKQPLVVQEMRWVVEGFASRITFVKLAKSKINTFDALPVEVTLSSLFDSTNKGSVLVEVTLSDSEGKEIIETKTIELVAPVQIVSFSEKSAGFEILVKNVSISLKETSSGRLLDTYSSSVPLLAEENTQFGFGLLIIIAIALIVLVIFIFMRGSGVKKAPLALLILSVLFCASVVFACQCNFSTITYGDAYSTNPSNPSDGSCCNTVTVTCTSCGNCNSARTSASASCTQTGGNFDHGSTKWKSYTCCQSGISLWIGITGGDEAGYGLISQNTYSCCSPNCNYTYLCGQSNGCGGYCSTSSVSTGYVNSCDSTDYCNNTRTNGSYNMCNLSSNVACNSELVSQCDGADNDCDGTIDNGSEMFCSKNLMSGQVGAHGGDCTSQCKICQDNKVQSVYFKDVTHNNDVNTFNTLDSDTTFSVDVNALSPNSCVDKYNLELLFSIDGGSTWSRVKKNIGVGENKFSTSATVSFANTQVNFPNYFAGGISQKPLSKLSFAAGDLCSTSLDCNLSNKEICSQGLCETFDYALSCSSPNKLSGTYLPSGPEFMNVDCNSAFGGCVSDVNGVKCTPLKNKVCNTQSITNYFTLDSNSNILSSADCNSLNDEYCANGDCCKVLSRVCSGSTSIVTDSCGTVKNIDCQSAGCDLSTGACRVLASTYCSADSNLLMQVINGVISVKENCGLASKQCFDNNKCCGATTNLVCGASNGVYMKNTCGIDVLKQFCSADQTCHSGVCCTNDFNRVCSANGNLVYVYDSCNNQTIQTCSAGTSCSRGVCSTVYTPTDGEGYRVVDINKTTFAINFPMRYMPVGTKFKVRVQLIDDKISKNISGATYADNGWKESNILTVVNTTPSPPIVGLARVGTYPDNNLECYSNDSIDPDVFPVGTIPFGQSLNYFGRIYEDTSPQITGPFVSTTPSSGGKVTMLLVRERPYCCDGDVVDGLSSNFNSTCSSALKCNGTRPLDGNTVVGDGYFETGATLREWAFVSTPSNIGDCEWSCKPCYVKNGNTCVLSPSVTSCCVSGLPDGFGIMDSGVLASLLIPPVSKDWNFIFNTNNYQDPNFLNACEWSCAPGFNKVVDSNSCESLCRGTKPVGSDDQGVIVSTKISPVSKDWNYAFGKSVSELEACEWSCADKYERFESTCTLIKTPFVPSSVELGFDAKIDSFAYISGGKTQLNISVWANRKIQGFEDKSDNSSRASFSAEKIAKALFAFAPNKISVESIKLKKSDSTIISGRITTEVPDVTSVPKTLVVEMDTNLNGSYTLDLSYGGVFNGVTVEGIKPLYFTLGAQESTNSIPDANLLVAILALIVVITVISSRKK